MNPVNPRCLRVLLYSACIERRENESYLINHYGVYMHQPCVCLCLNVDEDKHSKTGCVHHFVKIYKFFFFSFACFFLEKKNLAVYYYLAVLVRFF